MSYNKYYQDELNYLRELGGMFGDLNPGVARFLSEEGDDPDVERLLEGFAFLTAKIRQKLDDELPEVSQSLIDLIWPNYLRPVPSMSTLEFIPKKHTITSLKTVEKGTEVSSIAVEGTSCKFQTCYDVEVLPIELKDVSTEDKTDGAQISLGFQIEPGVASEQMGLEKLRLHLHDDQKRPVSKAVYLWLFRYLSNFDVVLQFKNGEQKPYRGLEKSLISRVGFTDNEALLPGTEEVFSGYRLIQEYFQFSEKFLYFDISGLRELFQEPKIESFTIQLNFERQFQGEIKLRRDNFRLFCSPIVNLFKNDADPIRLEHQRIDYLVRPTHKNADHIEVFSVEKVLAKVKGQPKRFEYPPYESFNHSDQFSQYSANVYYKLKANPSVLGDGVDHFIRFIDTDAITEELRAETVSLDLLCTNRRLAATLHPSQVIVDTGYSPQFVTFRNISSVTSSLAPPLQNSDSPQDNNHWRLVSNLALHYRSLGTVDALKQLIKFYDFKARNNRQQERANTQMCEGIENIIQSEVGKLKEDKPILGLQTIIYLRESKFGAKGLQGEAGMFLFASVLNHYFAQYAQTNSFHSLIVKGVENDEVYQWPVTKGTRPRF